MAVNQNRIDERRRTGLLVGGIILSVVAGLVVWKAADLHWLSFLYTTLTAVGAILFVMSFFLNGEADIGPSESSYYMIVGYLLLVVGALGLVSLTVSMETWILAALFIGLVAAAVVFRSLSRRGRRR